MTRIKALILAFFMMLPVVAQAQVIPSLPYNLTNGTIADANQVMANFNQIVSSTNTNAANAGANTNITALLGLTTPLAPASGGSPVYTAGTSGGSANAQTVLSPTPAGYVLAAGRIVIFTAGFTNNGPTTLNVNSTGPIAVLQHAQSGLVPLAGGEIVATQATIAYYDGTQYQLFDASPQALVSACTEIDYRGVAIPSGYLAENGAAVARSTYANLFGCLAYSGIAASTVSGSSSVTVPNSALFDGAWYVGGTNITCNSTILSIPDGTHIVISTNAGATGTTTLTIGPYPQGDCSTTFNLPDARGRASVMTDSSGAVLSSTTCANPNVRGASCGSQTHTLTMAELPASPAPVAATAVIAASGNVVAVTFGAATTNIQQGTGAAVAVYAGDKFGIMPNLPVSTNTSNLGSGTAHSVLQPISLVTKAIKF